MSKKEKKERPKMPMRDCSHLVRYTISLPNLNAESEFEAFIEKLKEKYPQVESESCQ